MSPPENVIALSGHSLPQTMISVRSLMSAAPANVVAVVVVSSVCSCCSPRT